MDSVAGDADLTPECKGGVQEMQVCPSTDSVAGDADLTPECKGGVQESSELSCDAATLQG